VLSEHDVLDVDVDAMSICSPCVVDLAAHRRYEGEGGLDVLDIDLYVYPVL